jgi:hypothetical protein
MRLALWLVSAIVAALIGVGSPHWYFGVIAFVGFVLIGVFIERGRHANGRIES